MMKKIFLLAALLCLLMCGAGYAYPSEIEVLWSGVSLCFRYDSNHPDYGKRFKYLFTQYDDNEVECFSYLDTGSILHYKNGKYNFLAAKILDFYPESSPSESYSRIGVIMYDLNSRMCEFPNDSLKRLKDEINSSFIDAMADGFDYDIKGIIEYIDGEGINNRITPKFDPPGDKNAPFIIDKNFHWDRFSVIQDDGEFKTDPCRTLSAMAMLEAAGIDY